MLVRKNESSNPAPPPRSRNLLSRLIERRGAALLTFFVVALSGALGYFQIVSNGLLVLVLLACVVSEFVKRIDMGVPLMHMGALLACLQWLVGPLLSYLSTTHHDRYFMYVPEEPYFSYAIPATAAYILGMLGGSGSVRQRAALHLVDRSKFFSIGIILNVASFVSDILEGRVPGSLAFLFHLIGQLRYVGAIYLMMSLSPFRWHFVLLSCFPLFWSSGESGMFHDLILWSALLFTFWFAMRRRDARIKAGTIVLALVGVTMIQLVKQSMREKRSQGQPATFTTEFVNLLTGRSDAYSESAITLATARLNQGWIISSVVANVPRFEPYCGGETIVDAVLASCVPRFIWEEKKRAGGQENFRRFTGLPLESTTSMGISLLGEAYANYGPEGGIVFMGIAGVCFALSFRLLCRLIAGNPTFLFWIPLIYYQAVKAETELVVVMNQVVKGTAVAIAGHWLCVQYLRRDEEQVQGRPFEVHN